MANTKGKTTIYRASCEDLINGVIRQRRITKQQFIDLVSTNYFHVQKYVHREDEKPWTDYVLTTTDIKIYTEFFADSKKKDKITYFPVHRRV